MSPDDARHGKVSGYNRLGCREECCRRAIANYKKRWQVGRDRGEQRLVSSRGTRRRMEALSVMGWSYSEVARRSGIAETRVADLWQREMVTARVARDVDGVYRALAMTPAPPSQSATHARNRAARLGFAPPLAWDDIDHDDAPIGQRRSRTEYDGRNLIDEATVLRILAGEVLPANRAERDEIVRRWRADGRSERALCERMGWRDSRYGREAQSA